MVLEVEGSWAVVLTPDGRFVRRRVPAEGWAPGQEVSWGQTPRLSWRGALALACSLVFFLGGGGFVYQQYWALGPVVAYVSMDINPSLELGVDVRDRVCTAQGLNEDGVRLLEGLPYRRRPLERVVADLTSRAAEQGYLRGEEEGGVLITVTPVSSRMAVSEGSPPGPASSGSAASSPTSSASSSSAASPGRESDRGPEKVGRTDPDLIRQEAVVAVTRVLKERGVKAVVHGLTADASLRDEARRLNMSAGRLAVYLMARDAGVEIPLDKLRQGPLVQVFREAWEDLDTRAGQQRTQPGISGQPASVSVSPAQPGSGARKEIPPGSVKKGSVPAQTPGLGTPPKSVAPAGEKDGPVPTTPGKAEGQPAGERQQRQSRSSEGREPNGPPPGEREGKAHPGVTTPGTSPEPAEQETPDDLTGKWREKWRELIGRPDVDEELRGLLEKFRERDSEKGGLGGNKDQGVRAERNQ